MAVAETQSRHCGCVVGADQSHAAEEGKVGCGIVLEAVAPQERVDLAVAVEVRAAGERGRG
jgi:hypothetical protein